MRYLILIVMALSGCQSSPWYAKMAEKNPQCVELVKHMTCEEFVESSQRVNVGLARILARDDIPVGSRKVIQAMYDIGKENIQDVNPCQKVKP